MYIYVYVYYNTHILYTYYILIISYYIHISEFKNKLKYSILNIQIKHIFIKFYHVLKHHKYVKILKIQK